MEGTETGRMMIEIDESVSIAKAVAGDADALAELLTKHTPGLRSHIAANIGKSWQSLIDADDVLQITFMEAFLRIGNFRPTGSGAFFAWLRRVSDNNLRDAIRELGRAKRPDPRMRTNPTSPDDSCFFLLEQMGFTSTTPSRDAARVEAATLIDQKLKSLPKDYQQVVSLCDLQGASVSDAAASMGRSVGSVHMLRARAHDRLRDAMGGESKYFSRVR